MPIALTPSADLEQRSVNTIRGLTIDAVQAANSGHPGMPMGMADAAYVLWTRYLKHNPTDPTWPDRDRFILSAGHGSMLLYSLLHLTGYDLPLSELQQFRQWGSKTPGHPEYGHTPGVETTTGPLGQGIANAAGFALAEAHLAAVFNRPDYPIVNHYTYVIASDGDLMEGISHEAASLAGHLKLHKLIVLYDSNRISIDGSTDLTFTEDVGQRFAAYGWHVQHVDGHDRQAVAAALDAARTQTRQPALIIARTSIGYGSPNKQDSAKAHGAPLGADEVRLTKAALGIPLEPEFAIAADVAAHMCEAVARGQAQQAAWEQLFAAYRTAYPDLARRWDQQWHKHMPDWDTILPSYSSDKPMATRVASHAALNAIAPHMPALIGGSADLHASNNTLITSSGPLQAEDYANRNIYYGVREHGMAAAMVGLALHGGLIPYGGTFLIFSDYMRNTIRLSALSKVQVIYIFTHDSIGLGEDGPTHQPIEQIPSLRAIPNLVVLRPADATETAQAWRIALERTQGPTALLLTRQNVRVLLPRHSTPVAGEFASVEGVQRGAYTLTSYEQAGALPDVLLLATGSEVEIAIAAAALLQPRGIAARVVSMPSWELFEQQPQSYRDGVLPPEVTARVSIEAAATFGWSRYIGPRGVAIGLDHFGASAPADRLYAEFGLTAAHVAEVAASLVQ